MLGLSVRGMHHMDQLVRGSFRLIEESVLLPREMIKYLGPMIIEEVQNMLGSYQSAVIGPFGSYPAWAPLTPYTLAKRKSKGINPNDQPLLETRAMHDALAYQGPDFQKYSATIVVGYKITAATRAASSDGLGIYPMWHEMGTLDMPPRPTLGPGLMRAMERNKGDFHLMMMKHRNLIFGGTRGYVRRRG